jgi:hypothetical protein
LDFCRADLQDKWAKPTVLRQSVLVPKLNLPPEETLQKGKFLFEKS